MGINGNLLNIIFSTLLLVFIVSIQFVSASELVAPTDRIILTVSGSITVTNHDKSARFDRNMLLSLPQHVVHTETIWTNETNEFSGPYVKDVLNMLRAKGNFLIVSAINNYQVEIPISDFYQIPVVMALARNGKYMSVREKGPIWIIYPWSEQPQLKTEIYHSRSVWQVNSFLVK